MTNQQTNLNTINGEKDIKKLIPLFSNTINKNLEEDKKTNYLKNLSLNNSSNINSISFSELLTLNLKGIILYYQLLSSTMEKSNEHKKNVIISNKKSLTNLKEIENIKTFNSNPESSVLSVTDNNNKIGEFVVNLKEEFSSSNISDPKGEGKISEKITKSISKYMQFITHFDSKLANAQFKNISYNFNVSNNKTIKNIDSILESLFLSLSIIISKPILEITSEKVVIRLFYYFLSPRRKRFNKFSSFLPTFGAGQKRRSVINNFKPKKNSLILKTKRLEKILKILNYLFKKPVKLELIRLHSPCYDSHILVRLIAFMINRIKVRNIGKKALTAAFRNTPKKWNTRKPTFTGPSYLSGINIKVAGRLLTHRVVPRQTVKIVQKGILAKSRVIFSDVARFTNKNKRGAYSITVSMTNTMKKSQQNI
jgi:ribosomal VAR1-like protein